MFQKDRLNLFFNGKAIYRAIDEISEIVDQDDNQAILRYGSLGYAHYKGYMNGLRELWPDIKDEEDFKLINRNILCVDKEGNEIWRIEAPHLRDRRADSFIHFSFNNDKQRWEGTTHMGHECVVDVKNGKLSNIQHYATK